MLNLTPKDFLYSEIAGRFGKDKESWENRLLWCLLNIDHLEELASEAKEPILYQAAVQALRDVEAGKPTGYPVMFDCSASGMQLLSILTGDRNAARICNVIGQSFIDPYMHLHGSMQERLGTNETIERDSVKQAIMTSLYGSEAEPGKLFQGDALNAFYETMEAELPLCWELNQAILDFLKESDAESYDWVMPDNFHVFCPVTETVYTEVACLGSTHVVGQKKQQAHRRNRSLGANMTHSVESFLVRELIRRCNVPSETRIKVQELLNTWRTSDKHSRKGNVEMVLKLQSLYEKSGFMSARIFEYLDNISIQLVDIKAVEKIFKTVPDKTFPIKSVHDCYATHPNNALDLLLVFRSLYAELSQSNMLNYLLGCISGDDMGVDIEDMSEDILQATYILT
ncbi:hypothetical protein ZC03_060 [Pseudomonas phage ZC03]|uniref:DNA-directed RNA polymerase n=1 Tax=Pseudomonas phage ZC03 TaxID=1622115 RepID=A0A1L2C956_9CAUD|nr:RNA polymerase [Pseudomonas phage ZC03]AMD43437.1 hypothetical protein ZC03_060 [Pseudomonas phage ZC03]